MKKIIQLLMLFMAFLPSSVCAVGEVAKGGLGFIGCGMPMPRGWLIGDEGFYLHDGYLHYVVWTNEPCTHSGGVSVKSYWYNPVLGTPCLNSGGGQYYYIPQRENRWQQYIYGGFATPMNYTPICVNGDTCGNNVDDNNNGLIDEGCCVDHDSDGFFLRDHFICSTGTDCNDNDPAIYPGAAEACDGKDNNCNGQTDEGLSTDADGDGHFSKTSCAKPNDDCNDTDAASYPGASEKCGDLKDNNCNGQTDENCSSDCSSCPCTNIRN